MDFGKSNKHKIAEKITLKKFGITNSSNLPEQARYVNQRHNLVLQLEQSCLNAGCIIYDDNFFIALEFGIRKRDLLEQGARLKHLCNRAYEYEYAGETCLFVAYVLRSTNWSGKQGAIAIPASMQFVQSILHACIDATPAQKTCWMRDDLLSNSYFRLFSY